MISCRKEYIVHFTAWQTVYPHRLTELLGKMEA